MPSRWTSKDQGSEVWVNTSAEATGAWSLGLRLWAFLIHILPCLGIPKKTVLGITPRDRNGKISVPSDSPPTLWGLW